MKQTGIKKVVFPKETTFFIAYMRTITDVELQNS